MLAESNRMTYEEFLEIDKGSQENLEFIDGILFNQASPSTEHQRIVGELFIHLGNFFKGKDCKPYISPFDIIMKNKNETNRVQPDISVICDKTGFNENNYVGAPSLIIEVLSPSTMSKDFIKKMDLYMRFGVKEYWIVSPRNKEIQVFILQEGSYSEMISYKENDILNSNIFSDLKISLNEVFL